MFGSHPFVPKLNYGYREHTTTSNYYINKIMYKSFIPVIREKGSG